MRPPLSPQDEAIRARLVGLVTPALVEEHRARPFCSYSRSPSCSTSSVAIPAGPRYVVLEEGGAFAIGTGPAVRGAAVPRADERSFAAAGARAADGSPTSAATDCTG